MQNKDFYTTGEAARILNLSQRAVIKNFDSGKLTGFLIPGSTHRRISKDNLLKFAGECGHSVKELLKTVPEIDIFSGNSELIENFNRSVENLNLEVNPVKSGFDLGLVVFQVMENIRFAPPLLVIDIDSCSFELAGLIIEKLKSNQEFKKTAIWAVTNEDDFVESFKDLAFDRFIDRGLQSEDLSDLLTELLGTDSVEV